MNQRKHTLKVGKPPGSLLYTGINTDVKSTIILIDFEEGKFSKQEITSPEELKLMLKKKHTGARWIRMIGFTETKYFTILAEYFKIHELTVEDILNVYQRPKIEEIGGLLFAEIDRLLINGKKNSSSNQISLLLSDNCLVTFQDFEEDFLKIIEQRIEQGKIFADSNADAIFYAVFDLVIDEYYIVLEQINDEVEDIEEMFFSDKPVSDLKPLQHLRNELRHFRQSIWPVRDIMNKIHKKEISQISEGVLIYFNDTHDHINQVIEILENLRESTLSLIDVYMSFTSNRLNDIMKVLTVISTIFMPLTFIAGIYGMNFHNMPEISKWWGYPATLLLMLSVALGFVYYFKKKKWF
ncbi:MAG: magnesium/cobalt transporter CorA [Ignavibacteriales bacterium]|nr:magnesium/cobalt transporter CorA [Ignavibacteriales bacterium]